MHHRYRRLMILMLALAWLIRPARLVLAVEQAPALAGTVSMVVNSLALGAGVEWGQGILTLPGGRAIQRQSLPQDALHRT